MCTQHGEPYADLSACLGQPSTMTVCGSPWISATAQKMVWANSWGFVFLSELSHVAIMLLGRS